MLRDLEIYNYHGEWIVFVTNPDTGHVEWCACNYRIYTDMMEDIENIRDMTLTRELKSYEPTIPHDEETLKRNEELINKKDGVRVALWKNQAKYLHEFDQLFFGDLPERKIKIIAYKVGDNAFSLIALNRAGIPIWCRAGYRGHITIMQDIRMLKEINNEEIIKNLPRCSVVKGFNDNMREYYCYLENSAMSGQIIRIEF